jgi:hypothetical protein
MPKLTDLERLEMDALTMDAAKLTNGDSENISLQGKVLGRVTKLLVTVISQGLVTVDELDQHTTQCPLRDRHYPTTKIRLPGGFEVSGFAVRDLTRLAILICTILILASQFGLLPYGG